MSHDPLCPQSVGILQCPLCPERVYGKPDQCRCDLIARVRADERERNTQAVKAEWAEAVHGCRADLRAKVEGLREESARERQSNLSRNEISERVGEDTAYAAVLALIDEAQP